MTDKNIIQLQKSGEYQQAFNAIVDSYSERLYWHIRRFVCSHDDTNDLLQDIYIKIWKALPSFKGDSQIYTWLYRIATNETLTFLRRQKIISFIELDSPTENMIKKIENEPFWNGDTLQRELHKAIQRLPQKQRIVFNMRYFEEMKYEDIAEITGTSVGSLKASYHHAYNCDGTPGTGNAGNYGTGNCGGDDSRPRSPDPGRRCPDAGSDWLCPDRLYLQRQQCPLCDQCR